MEKGAFCFGVLCEKTQRVQRKFLCKNLFHTSGGNACGDVFLQNAKYDSDGQGS